MKLISQSQIGKKIFAVLMTAIVVFTSIPSVAFAAPVVDLKANAADSLTLSTSTEAFVITLNTTDATTCEMTLPFSSGIALNTNFTVVPTDSTYPAIGGSVTFTVNCIDAVGDSASDSVTISLPNISTPPTTPTTPTIDVKANGSDGPLTLNPSDTYTYTWTSTNATVCEQTSPISSGISLNGTSSVIDSTNSFFPTASNSVTITVVCNNSGLATSSDSVIVSLAGSNTPNNPSTPSGGGGGGGGGRRRTPPVSIPTLTCPLITQYMRRDLPNDPVEVMKLQAFLKVFEGYDTVDINGVFDQATFDAVSAFQMKYEADILTPWGHTAPTGYVYILTLKKVNEIYCKTVYNLTQAQIDEITSFRALLEQGGLTPDLPIVGVVDNETIDNATEITDKGQIQQFALAVFSFPETLKDKLQCLYELILVVIVLYVLGNILRDVLYKDNTENVLKRFITKWSTNVVGLIVAIGVAYMLDEYCLLLPLLILLTLSLVWTILYPKHNKIRSYVKSWILVLTSKIKVILKR